MQRPRLARDLGRHELAAFEKAPTPSVQVTTPPCLRTPDLLRESLPLVAPPMARERP
jgi:hypothetical protein